MEALNIDDKCHVHWREGTLLLEAVVVERRPIGAKRRKKKQKTTVLAAAAAAAPASSSSSTPTTKPSVETASKPKEEKESPKVETASGTAAATSLEQTEPNPRGKSTALEPSGKETTAALATASADTSAVGSGGEEQQQQQQQQQLAKENDVANANASSTDKCGDGRSATVLVSAEDMEYYVHYVGHDRRLDEWLTLDSFELSTLQRAEPKKQQPVEQREQQPADQQQTTTLEIVAGGDNDIISDVAIGASGDGDAAAVLTAQRRRSSASGCQPNTLQAADNDNSNNNSNTDNMAAAAAQPFSISGGNWHGGRSSGGAGGGGGGGSGGDAVLSAYEREHEETTRVKNIEKIVMGEWEVEAWYYSPFPDPYSGLETLYVCEYCLTYMRKIRSFRAHRQCCAHRHPPGREIYRENDLAVYELDGKDHRAYCQKLCLLAKLFLDHKTLFYEVSPFFFYVVCKVDERGAHIAGYFSKEKISADGYNLACILTFPQFQKSGYGKFIISLSYELTKLEGKTGSPEKPLSDLGKLSYRSYWTYVLMNLLKNYDTTTNTDISIGSMSKETGIKTDDLISTLQSLDMLKVWKGQHVVFVEQAKIREYMDQKKEFRLCNPEYLSWTPPSKGSESAADDKNN